MSGISNAYIRGFFDGEGCITLIQYKNRQSLVIDIANNEKELLERISSYLIKKGIPNKIILGHVGRCYHIKIYSFPLVYKFIKLIKPIHGRFKDKIKNFMISYEKYQANEAIKEKRINDITELCLKGIGHTEISKIIGINHPHTYRYCRNPKHKHRFPENPQHLNRY